MFPAWNAQRHQQCRIAKNTVSRNILSLTVILLVLICETPTNTKAVKIDQIIPKGCYHRQHHYLVNLSVVIKMVVISGNAYNVDTVGWTRCDA
jgi:uncharacterized membrane protein